MSVVNDVERAPGGRFAILREETGPREKYSLGVSPHDVPDLVAALENAGQIASGYTIEKVLVALSEIGDPAWAANLDFDSEAERCVVRCEQRAPLRLLARRLERHLTKRTIRRIIDGLPLE
jgi:hypothetical protein